MVLLIHTAFRLLVRRNQIFLILSSRLFIPLWSWVSLFIKTRSSKIVCKTFNQINTLALHPTPIIVRRDEPQTRTHGLGSRFWFHVKSVFPSVPLTLPPVPLSDSLPLTLVALSELSTSKQSRTSKSCSHSYTTKIRALYVFWVEVRGVYKVRTCSSMNRSLWTKCLCCMCSRLVY